MGQMTELFREHKICAILRGIPGEKMEAVITSLYNGGIRLLEITFNQKSETRHQETGDAIRLAKSLYPDMCVGAGTVMSKEDAIAAHEAGAVFALAPNVNEEVIKTVVELGMAAVPGAMTPSEIANAYAYGAEVVKMFPAGELGLAYAKAVMAPVNHVPMIAVGGIDINNVKSYIDSGFVGAGVGSSLTNKQMIKDGDWEALTDLARQYVEAVK